MEKAFFYGIMLAQWLVFLLTLGRKPFRLRHLILLTVYGLYTLTFDCVFGEVLKLYYYIHPMDSLAYILQASILKYPITTGLYVFYLPQGRKVVWYTAGWIVFLLLLELLSFATKTIVLTGWNVVPWSIITYVVSFLFIYLVNAYLKRTLGEMDIIPKAL